MNELTRQLREAARDLLSAGKVDMVLGWEKGSQPFLTPPAFITKAEQADKLCYDDFAIHNLAGYLLDYRDTEYKIALCVKGCDSRSIIQLLNDKQLVRDRLYIIGMPCQGKRDRSFGLLKKCRTCQYPTPLVYDLMLADSSSRQFSGEEAEDSYSDITAFSHQSPDDRYQYWLEKASACVRCFACQRICASCNCRDCIFESERTGWAGRYATPENNLSYFVTRAMHVAGRCTECGECERICPAGLPLMQLNRAVMQAIEENCGKYQAGLAADAISPLCCVPGQRSEKSAVREGEE